MDRVQFFLVQFQHERQRRRKTAFAVPYRLIQAHVADDQDRGRGCAAGGEEEYEGLAGLGTLVLEPGLRQKGPGGQVRSLEFGAA